MPDTRVLEETLLAFDVGVKRIGVAMGNSRKEIRDCADWITGTNDSDGIADVLHRFVLTAA